MPSIAYIAIFIPILALIIPIVAILTEHQRRMAELLRRNPEGQYVAEVEALRGEMQELKQLVHQQTITLDNLVSTQTKADSSIQERIGTGAG